ncbi:MAG: ABC-type transport auxiliary lipoprotein family protein [Candidatus Acidiferrum sp.]
MIVTSFRFLSSILRRNSWPARRLSLLAACALVSFAMAACGSPRPIKYYQISYPTKSVVAPDAINTALMVRPFESSHLYLDNKIVYGFDSPEMGTYEYQRWADPPVEMLQYALIRGLRASGRFKAVYSLRADPEGRYILAGYLYDFKEVDGPTIVARLSYVVRLRDRKTGTTVWEHSYSYDEPVAEKTVSALAAGMDKNIQRSVQEIQSGLDEYFRANPIQ